MPVTPNFNIVYPDGPTTYAPAQQHFAALASSVDAALANGLGGAPRVANSDAERLTLFPSPVQGNLVQRPDKGWMEQYYGLYNAGTNPGGASTAGWYPVSGRTPRLSRRREGTTLSSATGGANNPFNLPTTTGNDTPGMSYVAATGVVTCAIAGWYSVTGTTRWQTAPADTTRRITKATASGLSTYPFESTLTAVSGAVGTTDAWSWVIPVPVNGTITFELNPSTTTQWFGDLNVAYMQPL